ncbi:hypothetical protein H3H37_01250 [Duganella sp. LX20W]|uniref:Uncharacterized protein n=1 Tax=Rugamonas brunnea TaxID=2758569 RepID=A0A7W2END2_9BURK|nr:hypothetical protein [Rugamonas brunnea]MBA5635678.1 hypothetical protein [Rugamonas brunnea]
MCVPTTKRLAAGISLALLCFNGALAQVTSDQVNAAKNAIDLQIYESTKDLAVQQKEAEARKAIAEAEKAEMLAKIPPADAKPLAGTVNTEKFGAAGLVKAFDLGAALATSVCTAIPKQIAVYDATITQGVVAARIVVAGMNGVKADASNQTNKLKNALNPVAVTAVPDAGGDGGGAGPLALPLIAGTIKAVADITSLFKTNVTYTSTSFGDGTREFFVTALAERCPTKIVGTGIGYLGELDEQMFASLVGQAASLKQARESLSDAIDETDKRIDQLSSNLKKQKKDASTDPQVKKLTVMRADAAASLKGTDAFIESLKISDVSDKSPLYSAARFLAYDKRVQNADVLDFTLRLEGMTIIRENLFTGQHLRLSGVAFLWYRIQSRNGTLVLAKTVRQITKPVQVDLDGDKAADAFWSGASPKTE